MSRVNLVGSKFGRLVVAEKGFPTLRKEPQWACVCDCGESLSVPQDRPDGGAGYRAGNCIPCCASCNYMKGTLSGEEFLLWCRQVADYDKRVEDGPEIAVIAKEKI